MIKIYRRGYTIVEILIIVSIVAILVTYGISSYAKAQERQTIAAAKEAIIATLQEAQKASYVGDKDCDGALNGVRITFSSNSITSQAYCALNNGVSNSVVINNVTFTTSPTITFLPLNQGVVLSSGTSVNIDYLIGVNTYRVTVSSPGNITYVGKI